MGQLCGVDSESLKGLFPGVTVLPMLAFRFLCSGSACGKTASAFAWRRKCEEEKGL
jgi:hypothetical protein